MRKDYIQIRLSELEKLNFKENANLYNLTVSSYIKFLNAKVNLEKNGGIKNE